MNDDACDDPSTKPNLVVAVGGSAGCVPSIISIVEQLPDWFSGTLLIALHRGPNVANNLRDLLTHRSDVEVVEPVDDECLLQATVYVGHPGDTVAVENGAFDITADASQHARIHRIDDLFVSVAKSAGQYAVGVILSGMLRDGSAGLKAIHDAGGYCIVQSPKEALHSSMPVTALAATDVNFVGTVDEIVSKIMERSILHDRH